MASGASVEPKVTAAWRLDKLLDIQSGNLGAATSIFLKHERPWDIQLVSRHIPKPIETSVSSSLPESNTLLPRYWCSCLVIRSTRRRISAYPKV